MINVTKTFLPDYNEYLRYINRIWKTNWITNNGKLVQKLEKELKRRLQVNNILMVSNGTLALQLTFKALSLKGEVITTPFTFAASTNSLIWEGLTPVFADIQPETYNIDPIDVEKKITSKTSAILAVHVYGNPCGIEELEKLAKKYKLKLIFDAAHAFGIKYKNKSILNYGDVSILSFHATKTFHTIEGGAIIARDTNIQKKINLLRNFGIKSEEKVLLPGINAKMNEFQAAMGLANLSTIKINERKRRKIYTTYVNELKQNKYIKFQKLNATQYNYSYMPILLKNKKTRDNIYTKLLRKKIKTRKYFFPLTSSFPYTKKDKTQKVAKNISNRILCLPIYQDLSIDQVKYISSIVKLLA